MEKREIGLQDTLTLTRTSFYKTIQVKRVLICFHGFMTSSWHDCTAFKKYFDSINDNPNFEVELVNLYTWGDKSTYSSKSFYKLAYEAVKKHIDKGEIVYLLSYSFSADLAARLTCEFPQIEKLCLISPTTYIVKTKLLASYISMAVKNLKLRLKYKRKAKKIIQKTKMDGIVRLAINIAKSIVKNRKYLKYVNCKVFMCKGNKDEFSISQTFHYISRKSKNAIIMSKTYPDENHVMFCTLEHGIRVFQDVLRFTFHMKKVMEVEEGSEEKEK